jgi:3-deoxy-D-manno-octulosonic-acid transferase
VIVAYGLLLVVAFAISLPVLLVGWTLGVFGPRGSVWERLQPLPRMPAGTVWVHVASVGEAEAALPLLTALAEQRVPVIATALTLNGRARLRARLPRMRSRLMPLDLPGLIHVSLARAQVEVVVLVETELWPVLMHAAHRRGARVIVAGGRISDRSWPRYRLLRPFFGPLLAGVREIGARGPIDRERFVALGAASERTSVVGDLKLDREVPLEPAPGLREALGAGPFLVGGSTHPGEEEALLEAWQRLVGAGATGLRLVLAPRHPERSTDVCKTVQRRGARVGTRSEGAADCEVVVVDSVGELASLYGLAELVFVGGTLAHVGGHNLVEPVQAGRVVVHGPYIHNQRTQADLLAPLGVLYGVENAAGLAETLLALWADPDRNAPAREAAKHLEAHRGATARALASVLAAASG